MVFKKSCSHYHCLFDTYTHVFLEIMHIIQALHVKRLCNHDNLWREYLATIDQCCFSTYILENDVFCQVCRRIQCAEQTELHRRRDATMLRTDRSLDAVISCVLCCCCCCCCKAGRLQTVCRITFGKFDERAHVRTHAQVLTIMLLHSTLLRTT